MNIWLTIVAVVTGALSMSAWAQQDEAGTVAPARIPVVAPKGHVVIDGACFAKKGNPSTYQIVYVADQDLVGKALQVQLKDTIQVEKQDAAGKKQRVNQSLLKYAPITLKKEGQETISIPELQSDKSTIEVAIVAAAEKPDLLSNSLTLRPTANTWALPEGNDIAKMAEAMPAKPTVQPAKPRKVLVYTALLGFPHSSVPIGARAIQIMGQKSGAWETVISNDRAMFEPETLEQFDAVMMMSATGELFGAEKATNERLRKSLLDFVANGKGLAGSHAATDCSYKWAEYGQMIGGYFQGHPFRKIVVKVDDPGHPINAAFKGQGFEISDEMYTFREPYSRQKLRILLSIDMEKTKLKDDPKRAGFKEGENRQDHDYAISWVQEHGKGRVFYCSFGHDHNIFWTPSIMQHYLDGMQYVLGDLKADAAPSAK